MTEPDHSPEPFKKRRAQTQASVLAVNAIKETIADQTHQPISCENDGASTSGQRVKKFLWQRRLCSPFETVDHCIPFSHQSVFIAR